ncbi:hypothetical protein SOVF_040700 [Spinacia oleracea]|uniref:Uncharacterized protein n=1 Tax=Spinacia oleracea TaxID=3562 RepID=A0A9R0I7L6_SPIOL|nr:uncharacterized protein LOC110783010 [Spinacia oleracea]KNA21725.1 hypothetical protein SOVF_040700 [Spinacia oleracea]
MASVQQPQVFNDKQKAAIEKAMQDAQNVLSNNDNAKADGQYQLVAVGGVMENDLHRPIRLMKTHSAKGQFVTNPSGTIGGEALGVFVHQGATSHGHLPLVVGSKCAIIYATFDKMAPALGYLLAWDKPDDSNQVNKVYVEAGDPYKLEKMEWSEIEKKLDASTDKSRYYDNNATFAAAVAEIKDNGNKRALVAATFYQAGIIDPKP